MQAIVTKFIGPTNFRPSRIKATAAAGSIIISWDSSHGITSNHAAAAKALVEKLGWCGRWIGGGMPDDDGFVFVCDDSYAGESFTVDMDEVVA